MGLTDDYVLELALLLFSWEGIVQDLLVTTFKLADNINLLSNNCTYRITFTRRDIMVVLLLEGEKSKSESKFQGLYTS